MNNFLRTTALVLSGSLLLACSDKPADSLENAAEQEEVVQAQTPAVEKPTVEQASEQLAVLNNRIRSMAGMAQASELSQCRMIGVGSRPCGGPEYYMTYSTQSTDVEALETLVDEYTKLRQWYNEEEGVMGTCEVIPEPKLTLQGGVCRALPTETM